VEKGGKRWKKVEKGRNRWKYIVKKGIEKG